MFLSCCTVNTFSDIWNFNVFKTFIFNNNTKYNDVSKIYFPKKKKKTLQTRERLQWLYFLRFSAIIINIACFWGSQKIFQVALKTDADLTDTSVLAMEIKSFFHSR